jgi:hypothetical protein
VSFTLTAVSASGATLSRYTGAWARLALNAAASYNFGAIDAAGPTVLGSRIDTSLIPSIGTAWGAGTVSLAVPLAIQRAASPDGPFASLKLGFAPVDLDGVALDPAAFNLDANNDAVNESALLGTTASRFGRLRIQNALASSGGVPLPMPIEIQYWNGSSFVRNTDDGCTTLTRDNFSLSNYKLNLNACETRVRQASVSFSSGVGTLTLDAPGTGNNGSVVLTPNLGTAASGNYCATVGGAEAPANAANRAYLQGAWSSSAYTDNPSATAGWGVYGSQPRNFIFLRENY